MNITRFSTVSPLVPSLELIGKVSESDADLAVGREDATYRRAAHWGLREADRVVGVEELCRTRRISGAGYCL